MNHRISNLVTIFLSTSNVPEVLSNVFILYQERIGYAAVTNTIKDLNYLITVKIYDLLINSRYTADQQ